MTLRSKLAVGLMTIAAILVVPLVMAVQSLARLHDDARTLRDREFAASVALGKLRGGLEEFTVIETNLLVQDDSARPARVESMKRQVATLSSLADSVGSFKATPNIRSAINQIVKWVPLESEAALSRNNTLADSIASTYVGPATRAAERGIQMAEGELNDRITDFVEETTIGIDRTRAAAIAGMLLALGIAAAIAFFLTRSITRPITALDRGMRAVADGDLSVQLRLDQSSDDELGRLATSFDSMTRQLLELDKLKAEFVSVASHELKTPVNVIVGYLQLLEEGIYGPLTPKQLDVHKTLEMQAQTLLRLTRQLLDVSRFEAGGGRLDIRRIVLAEFFEELERSFHVLAVQREVTFVLNLDKALPADVHWDLDRVNEVLGNLLSNAFKFTGRGGTVELTATPVDQSVSISIRDTGAGIPPEQLPRIFEKFYQADSNQKSLGSGLGLAIAKQIVDAHGGSISCESTLGVGTTFTIVLPTNVQRRSSSHMVASPLGVA